MVFTQTGLVDLLVGRYPVAYAVTLFLSKRDLWSLSLTCWSLRRSLRLFAVGKAKKSALKIVDDFDRFREVLRSTNSYIELDEKWDHHLWHPLARSRVPLSPVINVYVCGDKQGERVGELKQYFEDLGYQSKLVQRGHVSVFLLEVDMVLTCTVSCVGEALCMRLHHIRT